MKTRLPGTAKSYAGFKNFGDINILFVSYFSRVF